MPDPGDPANVSSPEPLGAGETVPAPAEPASAAGAPGRDRGQLALVWDAAGAPGVAVEPAEAHKRHYRGARGDWRRATEFLAGRGKLPLEQLHDIARMSPEKAVKFIMRVAGMGRAAAWAEWRSVCSEILPYTAAKLATLEGVAELGAAMGAGAMHYLAASTAGRASGGVTHNGQLRHGQQPIDIDDELPGNTRSLPVTTLPPRGAD